MYVGVDGCRAGWLSVSDSGGALQYAVFDTIRELAQAHSGAVLILLDIPIGLPGASCPVRPCDTAARKLLGSRACTVFSAPSRPAAHAEGIAEARLANMNAIDSSLSAQAWGICKKIAEVDDFLLTTPEARGKVREMHPEICFWSLNGRRAIPHSKKSGEGIAERLAVLEAIDPRTGALYQKVLIDKPRKEVQRDDVLDALVGCLTATALVTDNLLRLSGDPDQDERGLPMEMVYRAPTVFA